ncbi:MAG: ATP-binding cassette domain-containing protein [Jaaginema sp. PMC 1079.18]|nr:ATP-binding cassette domain-containing protein [Jaaginema sp. PMC 1080.18]MEC4851754.1 ATP-binding cassette domain-containing protein [Jaaginema sp. PMC 1079.18]MEC4866599.1 ATP-binding cassette domain-containing protein [Jaaginema sp. PMC 1078.18]
MAQQTSANRMLLKFLFQYPWLVTLTIILGFSGAFFNGVSTALIVPLVLAFLGQNTLERFEDAPPILNQILGIFDAFSGDWRLIAMLAAVLLTIILKNGANYAGSLVGSYLSRSLVNGIRLDSLRLLLDVDLDYYSKHKIGEIINWVNQEVSRTAGAIGILIGMLSSILTILVFTWLLLSLSWQLTLVSTFILGLVALANQYYIRRAKAFGRILSKKSSAYSNKFLEILTGIRLIKTVSREDDEYLRIQTYIKEREKAQLQSQANYAAIAPINEVLGIFTILAIVVAGRYLFADQIEALSAIMLTYLVVLFRLLPFVSKLNGDRSKYANSAPSAEIVADFLNRDRKPIMTNGDRPYQALKNEIRLEKVSFAYPGQEDQVLSEIDLTIPKGKTIALVGSSGAGKSTLADLLPRFYDVTNGRILFDNTDLRDYNIGTVRQSMGIVSQDTFLFNNTVRYNIAYGVENATDEAVFDAAKRANAYDFILQLPQGFNTEIGDRGVMLSGGQRQRLAIARALLRNPDILILDEATSALDTVSERLVQEAIDELCRDRTTLVIAHRLSTVQKAHQIVVLEKGRIMEIGNHYELLEKAGFYAKLYEMQFSDRPKPEVETEPVPLNTKLKAKLVERNRLSYETRTLLNSILGSLQLLTDEIVDTPDEQQELIEESYKSALKLLQTISAYEESSTPITIQS